MTEKTTGEQDALTLAKEALEKTDKEKSPKLYESREATVKALENYKQQEERAQLAEKKAKEKYEKKSAGGGTPKKPKGEDTPTKSDLSQDDLLSLVGIHKDDRPEVVDYAKFKNISVEEALKSNTIKTTLREKAEERKTADATNTGGGKRGSSKVSGETLLKKAEETGEMPESDADLDKMLDADLERKQKEAKNE